MLFRNAIQETHSYTRGSRATNRRCVRNSESGDVSTDLLLLVLAVQHVYPPWCQWRHGCFQRTHPLAQ